MERAINPAALKALLSGDMANYIAASTEGGIESQERAGGEHFRHSDTLPKDCRDVTKEQLEKIGIVFGKEVDNLFVEATLPEGWKKTDAEHDYGYWTYLVDNKGRKRAAIFYKAAYYDRRAHLILEQRYSVHSYENCDGQGELTTERSTHLATVIKDEETIIHCVGFVGEKDYDGQGQLAKQGRVWLDAHYPVWQDATAYWD